MNRFVLIIASVLLAGSATAQTVDPNLLESAEAETICPIERMDQLAALDAPALWTEPTAEPWPSVIAPISAMRRTAPARVYATDPFDGAPIDVTLSGLVGDGRSLDGEFVRVGSDRLDGAGVLASEASGDFRFDPDTTNTVDCITDLARCPRFDAVNVYYHVDTYVRDFWIGELDVTPSFVAEARVHIAGDGGFADWPTRSLKLGVGNIFMKNSALSDDLIYHEYNHLVMASLGFEIGMGVSEQTRALHEAYADYFMATWTDDPRVGEWVVTCPPRQQCTGPANDTDLRTLDLDAEAWNWRQGQPADTLKYGFCLRYHEGDRKCKASWNNFTNPYVWGMMWASSLWDLRTAVGADVADVIALEAVRLHTSMTDFQDALEQILSVGHDRFGPNVGDQVRLAFEQHGFMASTGVWSETAADDGPTRDRLETWPNPVRDVLQVRMPSDGRAVGNPWVVHDMTGRAVLQGRATSRGLFAITTSDLPPGLYRLRIGVYPSSKTVLFLKMH